MKKIAAPLLILCLVFACRRTPETPSEIKVKVAKAMIGFLYREGKFDSAKVKYQILDTIYFEEKYAYLCRFNVHVIAKNYDTTGIMTAEITKDMSKVTRQR